jgi:hypothetical protein
MPTISGRFLGCEWSLDGFAIYDMLMTDCLLTTKSNTERVRWPFVFLTSSSRKLQGTVESLSKSNDISILRLPGSRDGARKTRRIAELFFRAVRSLNLEPSA